MKKIFFIVFMLVFVPETYARVFQNQKENTQEKAPAGFLVSLKTNLLYDAALVPDLGLELTWKNRWSLTADWMYAWWSKEETNFFWRIYGGSAEFRYWFGKRSQMKNLEGHHIGIYGQMMTYDFELGGRGYLGDKWTYAGGISYGYSHPISKNLNLDFSIGIGYLEGNYEEYLPEDGCYVWQVTKKRRFIGPTKLEVSLVWVLDYPNHGKNRGKRK